ncbi:N-6 DNA methylase [Bizionia paragorgiae]|uniref:class I SAM-dependent DNA methyltransferase n=1 Tax=Bizionia paragorgiae TaxID=283786 RepID=UPI003A8DC9DF
MRADLKSKVNKLWDNLWSGGLTNPATAIDQLSYLLFIRRLDKMDTRKLKEIKGYKSIFSGKVKLSGSNKSIDKKVMRWSYFTTAFKVKDGSGNDKVDYETMREHIETKVFPFIKQLHDKDQPFTKYMKNAYFGIQKDTLLKTAVESIEDIYSEIEKEVKRGQVFQDTQGDIYEYLLNQLAISGKNGQFRTPRHIIQVICELVDPKLGEKVADPACGTGGFLLAAYHHILRDFTSEEFIHEDREEDGDGLRKGTKGDKLSKSQRQVLDEKTFYGFDIDINMVRVGLMNLMMHGITHPNIEYLDTLSKKYKGEEEYDVILANPPFKGSIDKQDINTSLEISKIGANPKTELLFIERIIKSLKTNGRAGVIIPDGVLFGSTRAHKEVRRMLLEECELNAVISMPSGVFKPYAGVSTAILVFKKGKPTKHVWFYEMKSDGRTLNDDRKRIAGEYPLPELLDDWSKKSVKTEKDRKAQHFYVPVKEIVGNGYDLSINPYKEFEYIEKDYPPPKEILKTIKKMEEVILSELKELDKMLK